MRKIIVAGTHTKDSKRQYCVKIEWLAPYGNKGNEVEQGIIEGRRYQ